MENPVLNILRRATSGNEYEGRLYIVGGYVRDKLLDSETKSDDIDLVIEGDALAVADFLWRKGVTDYKPVEYGQFGTTQIQIAGEKIEIVTARAETYRQGSRKPIVVPGTLQTDAERRDFTVNTFLENLDTGEIVDPLGSGRTDLAAKILRTPLDPDITFSDDPLRMLRACRFAAKLGFEIEPSVYAAIARNAHKCTPEFGISYERMRDELVKTVLTSNAALGLEAMRETGLLAQFAPELVALHGVTQNRFHLYDVWEHTLKALSNLPKDASQNVRLAMLFHDIGKPQTRTEDPNGNVHFFRHEDIGSEITRVIMNRLRFSGDEITQVCQLVALHMRYGAYSSGGWTNPSVRRLIRAVGPYRQDLFAITRADISACATHDPITNALLPTADLDGLSERMEKLESEVHITQLSSPLTGLEIMALLDIKPGPAISKIKEALTDAVVSGELAPDDKQGAEQLARDFYEQLK